MDRAVPRAREDREHLRQRRAETPRSHGFQGAFPQVRAELQGDPLQIPEMVPEEPVYRLPAGRRGNIGERPEQGQARAAACRAGDAVFLHGNDVQREADGGPPIFIPTGSRS